MPASRHPASFRDPAGYIFEESGEIYRRVNQVGAEEFDRFESSGLKDKLLAAGLLLPYQRLAPRSADYHCLIKPERIPFISYPYEWCFSELKAAAILTLELQRIALQSEMTLRDASAFNIQFRGTSAVFIDHLSFGPYQAGKPWGAYRQFCQHFLAPLSLMAYCDPAITGVLRAQIDGIPIELASSLLPLRSLFNFGILVHLHLHARMQKVSGTTRLGSAPREVSKHQQLGIIDSLQSTVRALDYKISRSVWNNYYQETNYSDQAMQHKCELVSSYIAKADPKIVWDLGANTGRFSALAERAGANVVAFDFDHNSVELSFREHKSSKVLPLVMDLTNPSPSLGWDNSERSSLAERGPADLVIALALIHHIAIANNVPLALIAENFARYGRWLIIEFVPKQDSQVQRLLASRQDIFSSYDIESFEWEFSEYFSIAQRSIVGDSTRVLYLMQRKD